MELDLNKMDPAELADLIPQVTRWLFDPSVPPPKGIQARRDKVALALCERLFVKAPPLALDNARVQAFDRLIDQQFGSSHAGPGTILYDLPYPKHNFLRYLVHHKRYLLHGSSNPDIDRMEPRQQTDWSGRPTNAVFASGDGIWPLFYAATPREGWPSSLRNACLVVQTANGDSERFYFFSIGSRALRCGGWVDGTIYVLPANTFAPAPGTPLRFDEWTSPQAVPVVAKLSVSPDDFPLLNHVTGHAEDEPIYETWLRYKERLAQQDGPALRTA